MSLTDPRHVPPAEAILPSCARPGVAGDWWTEPHKSCTGSAHPAGMCGLEIRCVCPCHKAPFITEIVASFPPGTVFFPPGTVIAGTVVAGTVVAEPPKPCSNCGFTEPVKEG